MSETAGPGCDHTELGPELQQEPCLPALGGTPGGLSTGGATHSLLYTIIILDINKHMLYHLELCVLQKEKEVYKIASIIGAPRDIFPY